MGRAWKYTTRKIRGEKRKVKVRKHMGKEQVRMVGVRNLTDKEAKREHPKSKRVKGYVNNTDGYHSSVNHYRPKDKKKRAKLFGLF